MRVRTSACVGKKLGCAYGFGVGDCVDMRLIKIRPDGDAGSPSFKFFFFHCGVGKPAAGVNNKRVGRLLRTTRELQW